MDDSSSGRIFGKIGFAILAIALFDIGFLNYWVVKNDKLISNFESFISQSRTADVGQDQKADAQTVKTEEQEDATSSPSPGASADTDVVKVMTTTKIETVVQTAQKEIFIPLGTGSTKSYSYVELAGLEVAIDPSKYSGIDSIVFEASLWVDGGNGRAWAELYVVDDKNPLIESQISNPTSTGVLKSSGKIPIPNASKTFRVQAKTDLVDYAAHVENARIKITLK